MNIFYNGYKKLQGATGQSQANEGQRRRQEGKKAGS